jgi:drug/metabolite transporter (DMT)-like permease
VPIDGKITLWLVGLALFNLTTHLSFVKAYQKGDASKIAIWEYSYLPTVSVMAFVIFDEIPEMAVIIGIGLIIAAGMLSLKSQQLQRALGRVLHR